MPFLQAGFALAWKNHLQHENKVSTSLEKLNIVLRQVIISRNGSTRWCNHSFSKPQGLQSPALALSTVWLAVTSQGGSAPNKQPVPFPTSPQGHLSPKSHPKTIPGSRVSLGATELSRSARPALTCCNVWCKLAQGNQLQLWNVAEKRHFVGFGGFQKIAWLEELVTGLNSSLKRSQAK